MRRIFIPLFSLASLLLVSAASNAQNNNPTTQCLVVANAQCNTAVEDFEADPSVKGYTFTNLTWTTAGNNRLATVSATGGNTFTVTTPSFFIQTFGSLTVGFSVVTGTGSNDVFAAGALPLTLNILNSSNVLVATCTSFSITAAGSYCFTIGDGDLLSGGMYKYQFVISTPAGLTGSRILGIDDVAFGANQQAVLPVKFAQFTAKSVSAGVQLNWTIDAEENTKGYEVERSADGRNYAPIAPISATGARTYVYLDTKPLADGFYRIKATDFDGKFGFSNILHMKGGVSSVVIKGFLSSSTLLTVQHDEAPVGTKISVTSADGRLLKSVVVAKGSQQTSIDVSSVRSGLMLVRYETSTGVAETIKIVKQ